MAKTRTNIYEFKYIYNILFAIEFSQFMQAGKMLRKRCCKKRRNKKEEKWIMSFIHWNDKTFDCILQFFRPKHWQVGFSFSNCFQENVLQSQTDTNGVIHRMCKRKQNKCLLIFERVKYVWFYIHTFEKKWTEKRIRKKSIEPDF